MSNSTNATETNASGLPLQIGYPGGFYNLGHITAGPSQLVETLSVPAQFPVFVRTDSRLQFEVGYGVTFAAGNGSAPGTTSATFAGPLQRFLYCEATSQPNAFHILYVVAPNGTVVDDYDVTTIQTGGGYSEITFTQFDQTPFTAVFGQTYYFLIYTTPGTIAAPTPTASPIANPSPTASPAPTATPTATATATPAPGSLTASTNAVTVVTTGGNPNTATVQISETGYTGAISVANACTVGAASVTPANGTGPSTQFTITGATNPNFGTPACTVTFSDNHGGSQVVSVTVNP